MKTRIVKHPGGGVQLMRPPLFKMDNRRRTYACWFASKAEAQAYLDARKGI